MKRRSKSASLRMLVLVIVVLPLTAGCGGKSTESGASPSPATSSASPLSVSPTPTASSTASVTAGPRPTKSSKSSTTASPTPTATISRELSTQSIGLVVKLFALVQDKKYAEARALITSPDKVWALSDMKRIKHIRLIRAQILQTSTPRLIVLLTTVNRSPKTVTGANDWPNVVKIAADPTSGKLTIVGFATGP